MRTPIPVDVDAFNVEMTIQTLRSEMARIQREFPERVPGEPKCPARLYFEKVLLNPFLDSFRMHAQANKSSEDKTEVI